MKRKGTIPWNNYCLRKFGTSIKKEIISSMNKAVATEITKKFKGREIAPFKGAFYIPKTIGKC